LQLSDHPFQRTNADNVVNHTYQETVRRLSERIVEAQRPIRILDAVKWDDSVRQSFFAAKCSALPAVDRAYYQGQSLGFDPLEYRRQFQEIGREVVRRLGQFNPVGAIMQRMCSEYETVVRMLELRGSPEFSRLSQALYGSAHDVFHAGDPTLADLGFMMTDTLSNIDDSAYLPDEEHTITAEQAVRLLQERLDQVFVDPEHRVRVILSDGIIADAAAGSNYLKVRQAARFNERDIRLLEVHEGWVHLGTTLNGLRQPVCTFLSKAPPSATITQEGLSILTEILSFASTPRRLRRLTYRIRAIDMAENGANFLEVFTFFQEQGLNQLESYHGAVRVFRGSTPSDGPFTKDISYHKGFILTYNFIVLAVRKGRLELIPLLFCGKTNLEDIRTLGQLVAEGLVEVPRFLPPPFADLNGLTAWMCYSNFLSRLSLERIEADYANLL